MTQKERESIAVIEHQLRSGYLDLQCRIYDPEIELIRKMVDEYKTNHEGMNEMKGE